MKYPGGFFISALVTSGEVPCVGPPPKGQPATAGTRGTSPARSLAEVCGSPVGGRRTHAMEKDELFWSHQTALVSNGLSARRARAFVRQHLLDHQQPGLVDDVSSVVCELAELVIA